MLVVTVLDAVDVFKGGSLDIFGMPGIGTGLEVGFMVLHMGGCDVINHGGLGLLVVVVVVAGKERSIKIRFHCM